MAEASRPSRFQANLLVLEVQLPFGWALLERLLQPHFLPMTLVQLIDQVRRLAVLAATASHEDREYVHKLRVATRRAAVIVDALGRSEHASAARRLLRGLRRLRRRAGAARDLDVRLAQIVCDHLYLDRDTRVALVHGLALARGEAQASLAAHVKKLRQSGDFAEWRSWVKRVYRRADRAGQIEQLVGVRLALSVQKLEELGTPWPVLPKQLHRLRREVRRTRYLCEWLADRLPESSRRKILRELRACQEDLGNWHDSLISLQAWRQGSESPPATAARELIEQSVTAATSAEQMARNSCETTWAGQRFQQLIDSVKQVVGDQERGPT